MQILKDEIRSKILIAAEDIFYEKGFKEATTRSIANQAGISVSNLYLYYENKEAIFNGVVDEFYRYFMNGMERFLDHNDKEERISAPISTLIQEIMIKDQKKFVLIADKSQGTKYEGFKEQIITILNNHMKEQVSKEFAKDDAILFILSKNFIDGIIEIAKQFKDEKRLIESINMLVAYHMNGMKHLM